MNKFPYQNPAKVTMSHASLVQPYRRLLSASEHQPSTSDMLKPRGRSEAKITSACLNCKQKRIRVNKSHSELIMSHPSLPNGAI